MATSNPAAPPDLANNYTPAGLARRAAHALRRAGKVVWRGDGTTRAVKLLSRIDTPIEVDYFRHGGILPFVLRELMAA